MARLWHWQESRRDGQDPGFPESRRAMQPAIKTIHLPVDQPLPDCLEMSVGINNLLTSLCNFLARVLRSPSSTVLSPNVMVQEIGRASCRERVEVWVGAGGVDGKRE